MHFFLPIRYDRRNRTIAKLEGIGSIVMRELDPSYWFENPGGAPDGSFCQSTTVSKDPRCCSSLFFHSGKYFDSVCIFGRSPCVVMPIMHYNVSYSAAAADFGDRKTLMGGCLVAEVTRNEAHSSYRCILHILLKNMMLKVTEKRKELKDQKEKLGRKPTPHEMRNVSIVVTPAALGR